jgi:phosphoribosylformylglycinamidine cyclo-ligase
VALPELEKTLNMGAGMVAVLDPSAADRAITALAARDIPAWICGEVTQTPGGTVALEGAYAK